MTCTDAELREPASFNDESKFGHKPLPVSSYQSDAKEIKRVKESGQDLMNVYHNNQAQTTAIVMDDIQRSILADSEKKLDKKKKKKKKKQPQSDP